MSLFLLIWAISCLGFVCLAATMSKHQKQIFQRVLSTQQEKWTAVLGWMLLLLALLLCLSTGAISNMVSYCLGSLSFAAVAVTLSLSYYSHRLKTLVLAWTLIIVCTALWRLFSA